ncbi:MAG: peptidoglycan-associated lipoprotein Pal [Rickettsiales bacterium]|nr:peptidoglycan-associated lipoprotein Pal [Rickettsiales bacterium]
MKKYLVLLSLFVLVSCAGTGGDASYETLEDGTVVEQDIQEVNVSDRVYFALDRSDISREAAEVLNKQAEWLKSDKNIRITVEGHCDERGTREYNLALGERRANSVKTYLVGKGVSKARIKTMSYGKERPTVTGTGEAVWSKNRTAITVAD